MRTLVGITALLLVASACGSDTKAIAPSTTSAAVTTTSTSTVPATTTVATTTTTLPPTTTTVPGVGATLRGNDDNGNAVSITLTKLVDPASSGNSFEHPDAGKRYVAVQLRFRNESSTSLSLSPMMQMKVKDQDAQEYTSAFLTEIAGGQMLGGSVDLAPTEEALGFVAFELPAAAKVRTVKFEVAVFGGDALVWTL